MIKNNPLNNLKIEYRQLYINAFIFLFFTTINYAQLTPHYTQYLYNMQVINPAFVGSKADLSISFLSRKQWVGVEGAPETRTFSINARTAAGLGFGVTVINDKLGLANSNNINLDASYTLAISRYERLSFGLKGGITFFNNNYAGGITPDNEIYASNNGTYANIGFGGLYYTEEFFVGLSIPNILDSNQFKTLKNLENNFGIKHNNFFLSTGFIYDLSENFKLKPSTIVKYTPSLPMSVDLNANLIYKDKIETGLSYRYKESISALFAIIINKKYRVGYSYDNRLASYGNNLSSHEIIIRFDLNLNRNTRWLFHNRCYF
ncbi:type IX secretion system membrane protein PorP/SprF [Polaribacter sp. Z014]|uniref:PorP/SprF family type IX secretion system membrane protein n=1 Tax=unclassified Polaribacter TaxID=196858 RepID=UPI00193B9C53|nr:MULTISPECIES: type IX secretion system membrane protein PorP/SprF [unclassified Polaribacter]MCL7764123.1 type IX secretion system membrane protein PorP/SprF [Polaribacter sp. Z014]QVY65217.1 type IX secretion system membrane protein PorP/SprF [Polaribacter sp. Q13]